MKKTNMLLLVLGCCISTQAFCQSVNTVPAGKYQLTIMEIDGADVKGAFKELGMDVDDMRIEIQSGGKFSMTHMGDTKSGVYKLAGKNITLSPAGEDEIKAVVEDNKIIIEEKGNPETSGFTSTKMVFEKK